MKSPILDTHPHADHFSAAGYLKDMTGASTGIGERVVEVQRLWKAIYNLPDSVPVDGSQWDRLFADGERFTVGEITSSARSMSVVSRLRTRQRRYRHTQPPPHR
jgi:glyoxylase-like metal-dependent hydrolase (beta-lactamase superfamily II)